ncbi:uncharacterized protein TNCV_358651 [Trichonephila clavipes]|nr:uncharacterized protein TNCV_358651 [Trichonephila clavipes]
MISLEYFVNGLKDEEIQRAVRMADVQDLKSALKFQAATQASCIDRHSIRGTRVIADTPRHLRNNCPRVNQEHPHHANGIESKEVCGNLKGSAEGNGDVPSRRPCPENRKYCSRIEKKSGVIDQVMTPSTSELDPWSDDSVCEDQQADPEIRQLWNSKSRLRKSPHTHTAGKTSPLSFLQGNVTGLFGIHSI